MFQEFGREVAPEDPDDITRPTHNGAPTVEEVAGALQVWSLCNLEHRNAGKAAEAPLEYPTVAEAALAFGLPVALVIEAVEHHYWMFVGVNAAGEDIIEHEGA